MKKIAKATGLSKLAMREYTQDAIKKADKAKESTAKAVLDTKDFLTSSQALIAKLEAELQQAQSTVTIETGVAKLAGIPAAILSIKPNLKELTDAINGIVTNSKRALAQWEIVDDIRHERNQHLRKSAHTNDQVSEANTAAAAAEKIADETAAFLKYAVMYNKVIIELTAAQQKNIEDAKNLQQQENARLEKLRQEQAAEAARQAAVAATIPVNAAGIAQSGGAAHQHSANIQTLAEGIIYIIRAEPALNELTRIERQVASAWRAANGTTLAEKRAQVEAMLQIVNQALPLSSTAAVTAQGIIMARIASEERQATEAAQRALSTSANSPILPMQNLHISQPASSSVATGISTATLPSPGAARLNA